LLSSSFLMDIPGVGHQSLRVGMFIEKIWRREQLSLPYGTLKGGRKIDTAFGGGSVGGPLGYEVRSVLERVWKGGGQS